jgi:hypothetical protein
MVVVCMVVGIGRCMGGRVWRDWGVTEGSWLSMVGHCLRTMVWIRANVLHYSVAHFIKHLLLGYFEFNMTDLLLAGDALLLRHILLDHTTLVVHHRPALVHNLVCVPGHVDRVALELRHLRALLPLAPLVTSCLALLGQRSKLGRDEADLPAAPVLLPAALLPGLGDEGGEAADELLPAQLGGGGAAEDQQQEEDRPPGQHGLTSRHHDWTGLVLPRRVGRPAGSWWEQEGRAAQRLVYRII